MYDIFMQLLQERGLTPYRVSMDTGIPQSTLSAWKRGKSTPKLNKLQIIADYLGVSVDYLLGKNGEKNKPTIDDRLEKLLREPYMKDIYDILLRLSPEKRRIILAQVEALKKLGDSQEK